MKKAKKIRRYRVFVYKRIECLTAAFAYGGSYLINFLKINGHEIVPDPRQADYVILHRCSFTKIHRKRTQQNIKNIAMYNPKAKIIALGCARKILPRLLRGSKTELSCGSRDIDNLNSVFANRVFFNESPGYTYGYEFNKIIIVACRGCMDYCAYCGIKRNNGTVRSQDPGEVVEDIKKGLLRGFKDFWITGDDLGCYGQDINLNLPFLLKKISKIRGDFKITLRNINPRWINVFVEELANFLMTDKSDKWVFFPIQSANNHVLKSMGRGYTIEECVKSINRLKAVPGVKLYYEMLIGFPTETNSAFLDTVQFILDYPCSDKIFHLFTSGRGARASGPESFNKNILKKREQYLLSAWKTAQYSLRKTHPEAIGIFLKKQTRKTVCGFTKLHVPKQNPFFY